MDRTPRQQENERGSERLVVDGITLEIDRHHLPAETIKALVRRNDI